MKKLFLISISFLPALMFAASFSPYLGDEDWGGQSAGSDFLQNFIDPETGKEDEEYADYQERNKENIFELDPIDRNYFCSYCADLVDGVDPKTSIGVSEYMQCLEDVYNEGVLPVKNGEGNVIRYKFPGCEDPNCPIHHVLGYAADVNGNISEIKPDALDDVMQKPRLPVGEPFVMLLFAGVYAVVRKRQNAAKA